MKIHGLIYVCPECKITRIIIPDTDNLLYNNHITCAEDGVNMMRFPIDGEFINRLIREGASIKQ